MSFFLLLYHRNILPAWQHQSCCCGCTAIAMTQHCCLCLLRCIVCITRNSYHTYDTMQQTQAIMLHHCNCCTATATGPMLPCRQDVAVMQKQELRHRDKQSTLQRYEFHFALIQRTSSFTYFAVSKTTHHKLHQLKLGPTIYVIELLVARIGNRRISWSRNGPEDYLL